MAKKNGCVANVLAFFILIGLVGWGVVKFGGCMEKAGQAIDTALKKEDEKSAKVAAAKTPEEMRARLDEVLGMNNRDQRMLRDLSFNGDDLIIHLSMDENLTTGMAVGGALDDVRNALKAVASSALPWRHAKVEVTGPFTDKYGKMSEEAVIKGTWSREELGKVNWNATMGEMLPPLADSYWQYEAK